MHFLTNINALSIPSDCRVVKDMATGKSKGYGFVSFFNKWVSVPVMHMCERTEKTWAGSDCWLVETRGFFYSKTFVCLIWVTQDFACLLCMFRMQRMPYSRWEDSGSGGGRSGPTGPQGSLLLKLPMKVRFTAIQLKIDWCILACSLTAVQVPFYTQ